MAKLKLTVYLSTFNQEKYIREALDSILMQKTSFDWELLVADDCSTDKTQDIVLEYQAKYPEKISTYFTPVNVGGCKKFTDCIDNGLLRGEYIALLEGDDYWLNENRLQIMVDFLEQNPEYSRVSCQRDQIDEEGNYLGPDTEEYLLDKTCTIKEFLEGHDYSDFSSVLRNYFLEAGSKYNKLICASRNVLDFQDMFITQDFGPVYVMRESMGTYRCARNAGAANYNSITTQISRCCDSIRIAEAVEKFYGGKYDLSPYIFDRQRKMLEEIIRQKDADAFTAARAYITSDVIKKLAPEFTYLAFRGGRKTEREFICRNLTENEKKFLSLRTVGYAAKRIIGKLFGKRENTSLRGYVVS